MPLPMQVPWLLQLNSLVQSEKLIEELTSENKIEQHTVAFRVSIVTGVTS